MFESMYAAHGVGLAAPQIGIAKRIAVIDVTFKEDPNAKIVLVNPEIVHTEGKQSSSEGCLSLPEFRENVTRPMKVTARAQNLNGKTIEVVGEELLARALLHETDHLNGKLFISHISATEARPDQAQNSQADETGRVVKKGSFWLLLLAVSNPSFSAWFARS
jgi:peptide deformylase